MPFFNCYNQFSQKNAISRQQVMEYQVCQREHSKWLKLIEKSVITGLELTYRDLGNKIHFSSFRKQFFPPTQKMAIPKHNIKKSKELFSRKTGKQNLFCCFHQKRFQCEYAMFYEKFCCSCMYTKTARNTATQRNYASN